MTEPTKDDKAEAFDFLGRLNFILSKIRKSRKGVVENYRGEADVSAVQIEKVIFPPDGGVLTFFAGVEHPAKGFPYGETVETVNNVKRVIMTIVEGARGKFGGLSGMLKRNKFGTLIFLFLFRKQIEEIALSLSQMFAMMMREVVQDETMYCRSVKEFYRAFTVMIDREKDERIKNELPGFRDTLCMILEYDDAYRYRFQDIVLEINKKTLNKNLIKELRRLLLLAHKREIGYPSDGQPRKWVNISKFFGILSFVKGMKERIRIVLAELNLEEIRMDKDDLYHAKLKTSYNWGSEEKEE